MTLLDRYMLIALFRGGTPVFLLLVGLFGFFELALQLNDVGKGSFESVDAIRVVGFSLPRIAIDVLPVTCLLGCITGLGALASQQEITIMRATGMSLARMIRPLLWLVAAIALTAVSLQQFVVPVFEREASSLRAHALNNVGASGQDYWTRTDSSLVRVGYLEFGKLLRDLEIYQFNDQGRLIKLIQAESADVIQPNEWVLHAGVETQFANDGLTVASFDQQTWQGDLSADQIFNLITADYALSPADLYHYINHLLENGLDAHRYLVLLWQYLSMPLGLFAMALLGVPFITGSMRTVPIGSRITMGSMVGVFFYLSQRTLTQVGLLYHLPGALTGLLPVLVILTVAVIAIKKAR